MNIGISEIRSVCKFNLRGMCRFGNRCWNLHENPEKLVQKRIENIEPEEDGARALSPTRSKTAINEIFQPSTSSKETASSYGKTTESEEKVCGICFDTILKKVKRSEQTFGILPNCNHCFCFACIRKWRQSKEFDFDVSKACPECRVTSDFVYPSRIWMETKEEKENFIDNQRQKMKKQDCKYFRQGRGKCPFGNTCLYLHALPNGKILDVGPPKARRRGPGSMMERETELIEQILFWINDEHYLDIESDVDEIDLDDPYIAIQYYDKDDYRYYLAMDRLLNSSGTDDDDDDEDDFDDNSDFLLL